MSDVEEDAVRSDEEDGLTREKTGEVSQELIQCLTQEDIQEGLSLLCKTGNGLAHAFIKLDLKERGLSDISAISNFIHIRFLDLSNNRLSDLSPLASLTQLLWLKSFRRQPFAQLKFLQWLNVAMNILTDMDDLVGPSSLETLNLIGNRIKRLSCLDGRFANLTTLELRGNQMETTEGINLPNLRHLYMAKNVIKHLGGMEKLERLQTLHLRDNQIKTLDGLNFNMTCLQYLNVRGNKVEDENAIQSLRHISKSLQILVLSENPVVESTEYRINIVMLLPNLERLDKDLVTSDERVEAKEKLKELYEEETVEP
ncbi:leucine-rich repeat-containing protein 23 isoform X2 [Boleophthalmus pectinirostris]|uniref:leucine-rich repeat-containing protein 23 isoform X2 n=1 Tax=Boleophthalmus pectinirostris TaxID=150288 RepID=UPI00242B665C|nr:leucine-rich repeat-containing protein 23 isoform X2 [Boleophthalmus pectinirostris]